MPNGSAIRKRCKYCLPLKVKDGIYLNHPEFEDDFDEDSICCAFKYYDDSYKKKTKFSKKPDISMMPTKTENKAEGCSDDLITATDKPGTSKPKESKTSRKLLSRCSKYCDNRTGNPNYELPQSKSKKKETYKHTSSEGKKDAKKLSTSIRATSGADPGNIIHRHQVMKTDNCSNTVPVCSEKSSTKHVHTCTDQNTERQNSKVASCKNSGINEPSFNIGSFGTVQTCKDICSPVSRCLNNIDIDNDICDGQTFLVINCRLGRPRNKRETSTIARSPSLTTITERSVEKSEDSICDVSFEANVLACDSEGKNKVPICPPKVKTALSIYSNTVEKVPECNVECNKDDNSVQKCVVGVQFPIHKCNVPTCKQENLEKQNPLTVDKRKFQLSAVPYCENAPHLCERITLPIYDGNNFSNILSNKVKECTSNIQNPCSIHHAEKCQCSLCTAIQHNPYDVICNEHAADCRCSLCIQNTFSNRPPNDTTHPKNCYCSMCVERRIGSNVRKPVNSFFCCPVVSIPPDAKNAFPSAMDNLSTKFYGREYSRLRDYSDNSRTVKKCIIPLENNIVQNCDCVDFEPSGFDDEDEEDNDYWNSNFNLVRTCNDSNVLECSSTAPKFFSSSSAKPTAVPVCQDDKNSKHAVKACQEEYIKSSSPKKSDENMSEKICINCEQRVPVCEEKKESSTSKEPLNKQTIEMVLPCGNAETTSTDQKYLVTTTCQQILPCFSVPECPSDSPCRSVHVCSEDFGDCDVPPSDTRLFVPVCDKETNTNGWCKANGTSERILSGAKKELVKCQKSDYHNETFVKECDNNKILERCCLHLRPQNISCIQNHSEPFERHNCIEGIKYRSTAGAKVPKCCDEKYVDISSCKANYLEATTSTDDQYPSSIKQEETLCKPSKSTTTQPFKQDYSEKGEKIIYPKSILKTGKSEYEKDACKRCNAQADTNDFMSSSEDENLQRWMMHLANEHKSYSKYDKIKEKYVKDLRPDKGKRYSNIIFSTPPCEYIDKSKKLCKERCTKKCSNKWTDSCCQTGECKCECPCCMQSRFQVKGEKIVTHKTIWPRERLEKITVKDECAQTIDPTLSSDSSSVEEIFPQEEVITCKPPKPKLHRSLPRNGPYPKFQKALQDFSEIKKKPRFLLPDISAYRKFSNDRFHFRDNDSWLRTQNADIDPKYLPKDICSKSVQVGTCFSDSIVKPCPETSENGTGTNNMTVPTCPPDLKTFLGTCNCKKLNTDTCRESETNQICSHYENSCLVCSPRCDSCYVPSNLIQTVKKCPHAPCCVEPPGENCTCIPCCKNKCCKITSHDNENEKSNKKSEVRVCEPDSSLPSLPNNNMVLPSSAQECCTYEKESTIIVVIGGISTLDEAVCDRGGRTVWKCNIDRMTWIELAPLPQPRHNHGAAVVNHYIYVTGGVHPNPAGGLPLPTNTTYIFLICDNKWQIGPNLTRPRSHHGSTAFCNKVWILGGKDDKGKFLDCVEYLDIECQQWVSIINLPTCRAGLSTTVLRQKLYVIGGSSYIKTGKTEENLYQPVECYSYYNSKWHCEPNLPRGCFCACLESANGYLFLLGGAQVYQNTDDNTELPISLSSIYVLDEFSQSWNCVNRLDPSRYNMGSAVYGSKIFLFGGITFDNDNNECTVLDSGICYDASYQRLSLPTFALPCPLTGCSCIVLREKCNH